MNKKDKIFIAGAAGMVGSAIVRRLVALGYSNLVGSYHSQAPGAAKFSLQEGNHQLPKGLRLVPADLCDQTAVKRLFEEERPVYVFLAAAKVGGIFANNTRPGEFIRENLAIQSNIIHTAYQVSVERLLFLGSSCIYPKLAPQPMVEEHLLTGLLEPTNEPYAIAKIAGIKMCEAYNRQYGTQFIAVMPTNLYGPNDNFDLENSHVLPALIRKFHLAKMASEGKYEMIQQDEDCFGSIPNGIKDSLKLERNPVANSYAPVVRIWGSGTPKREFLHVDDMADACVHIMSLGKKVLTTELLKYPTPCFVNVGTGTDVAIRDLARIIQEVVDFSGEVEYDNSKPDGAPRKLLDVSRLDSLTWRASIDLIDGVKLTYQWYLDQLE